MRTERGRDQGGEQWKGSRIPSIGDGDKTDAAREERRVLRGNALFRGKHYRQQRHYLKHAAEPVHSMCWTIRHVATLALAGSHDVSRSSHHCYRIVTEWGFPKFILGP